MDRSAAEKLIHRFSELKILVLGDYMLDQFIWGHVDRISPEAPVPIVDVERESFSLGGAGNVVQNLEAMGAHAIPLGVLGEDDAGKKMLDLFRERNVDTESLFVMQRPTTVKTRILAHQQQVVRVDRELKTYIDNANRSRLVSRFLEKLDQVDGIIISDYSKGTITPNLLEEILPAARKRKKIVCVDPKVRFFSSYTPVTILTPNVSEASSVLGYPIQTEQELAEAGERILKTIDCKALLITRGDKGMALFHEGRMDLVPARAREVYDVTGAGDTVISVLCLALVAGVDLLDAVKITNIAAGIVVGKIGTGTVAPGELLAEF
ncbi:D-glycero-beta-D-manno-heptose-7-phosphate kinase [bacterium]|nr:D-glycero-beta-D-manno-heptose-7-phosphate kinase [bacterium]